MKQARRYIIVSSAGLLVDLSFIFLIASCFCAPLWVASAGGFLIASLFNYAAHEIWTFGTQGGFRFSGSRALRFIAAGFLVLVLRSFLVLLLETRVTGKCTLLILPVSVSVSLVINFFINKFLVFRRIV